MVDAERSAWSAGWIARATAQRRRGHLEAAIESLRQVLGHDPDHAEAHAHLALCLLAAARLAAARAEAAAAARGGSDAPVVRLAAAALARAEGRFAAAEAALPALLVDAPHDPDVLAEDAALARRRGELGRARGALERALLGAPGDLRLLRELAELHALAGDLDAADRVALALAADAPAWSAGPLLRARVAAERGDDTSAIGHVLEALRREPASVPALRLLAAIEGRRSALAALWWRVHLGLALRVEGGSARVMITLFVLYRVALILADAHASPTLARAITVAWIALWGYSFVSPELVRRRVARLAGA